MVSPRLQRGEHAAHRGVLLHRVVIVFEVLALFFAKKVDAEVDEDSVNPGVETGLPLEFREVTIALEEGFLDEVEGIFHLMDHAIGYRKELFLVARDELLVRSLVTGQAVVNQCIIILDQGESPCH